MRKLLTFLIALGAIIFAIVSPVSAQLGQAPTYWPVHTVIGEAGKQGPERAGCGRSIHIAPPDCANPISSIAQVEGRLPA
jgi:hypothetical protein